MGKQTSKKDDSDSYQPAPDWMVSAGPEFIAVVRAAAAVRTSPTAIESLADANVNELAKCLKSHGASMRPLFGASEERLINESANLSAAAPAQYVPDLSVYYRIDSPPSAFEALRDDLLELETIESAYIKPASEPAHLNDMAPRDEVAPPATADFTPRQIYLNPAPAGIDARHAWTISGGFGANVQIIDIEGAWRFSHEDLTQNQGGVIGGTPSTDIGWRNHGTAVVGEFGGDRNNFGITGICPDANVRAISIFGGLGSAQAIRQAASTLRAGDIILIELHRPGPRFNFANRTDQRGYIAIEWWPDDFDAIRFATARGVVVVEAGGNGAEDLDDPIYSIRPAGFPANWTNPFNRANRDSGAIVVGAGAPPPGTHGNNHGPDRSRLDFSNYGALIDAQGWGREVTTTGYGDLQGGTNEDVWYTDRFSGTSSASPIVVGAIGCVQGVLRARGRTPWTPARVRQELRATGSPQQDAPGRPRTQRIGNRPNLRDLITRAIGVVKLKEVKEKEFKELKEGKEPKEKDAKEAQKEVKDFKDRTKEEKEGKEFKEFQKELKDIFEGIGRPQAGTPAATALEQRVSELEGAMTELTHFIQRQFRPDLSGSPLANEPDSAQLQKDAADAKQTKDYKDVER